MRLPVFLALALWSATSVAACPPEGHDAQSLRALKEKGFLVESAPARQRLALTLVDCLGSPDPALRDGIAFEALSTWLRASSLDTVTRQALLDRLLPLLRDDGPDKDGQGFRAPFAALVLSEVARTDRVAPWLGDAQRAELVEQAAAYLRGVRDHRGFIDGEGWRHGVAHGADVAAQLAVNPKVDRAQLELLRTAVAAQVAPAANPSYIHGEPQRLAQAIFYIARRGEHDAADWQAWFASLAAPAPLPDWDAAFLSQAGLARRHNTAAFLTALYALVQEHGDEAMHARVLPGLRAAMKTVP